MTPSEAGVRQLRGNDRISAGQRLEVLRVRADCDRRVLHRVAARTRLTAPTLSDLVGIPNRHRRRLYADAADCRLGRWRTNSGLACTERSFLGLHGACAKRADPGGQPHFAFV